jgi:hypothetical protein
VGKQTATAELRVPSPEWEIIKVAMGELFVPIPEWRIIKGAMGELLHPKGPVGTRVGAFAC